MITKRTIEEVEAIARADDAEREAMGQHWLSEFEIQAEEARYRKQTPTQLIAMWKAGSNPEGKPLSGTEFRSLCAAWLMAFDALPPDADGSFGSDSGTRGEPQPTIPAIIIIPDGPISRRDVCELVGFSISTLDRMVKRGEFPKPFQVSERRVMFQGVEVRTWCQGMEAKRPQA